MIINLCIILYKDEFLFSEHIRKFKINISSSLNI